MSLEDALAAGRTLGVPGLVERAASGDVEGLAELAGRLQDANEGDSAVAAWMALTAIQPARGWRGLAALFEAAGLVEDAIACWEEAVAAEPTAEGFAGFGRALQAADRLGDAVVWYGRALAADPSMLGARYNLASILVGAGRLGEAISQYRLVVQGDPEHARAWCNLGVALRRNEQPVDASQALRRAVELRPGYSLAWANLASAAEAANEGVEARRAADRAAALDPGNPLAAFVLARLQRKAGELSDARASIDAVLDSPLPADLRGRALVERGFVLDRMQESGAFEAFVAGQGILARLPEARSIDPSRYPQLLDRLGGVPLPPPGPPVADPPVFVVGFPRSGTTLTEQVLAAHPAFATSDELPLLERTLATLPDYPAGLATADLRQLRGAYASTMPRVPGRFVDKFPLNLVHLPALLRVFPGAPLVLVLRDPRDVVLSCLMQDFVPNDAMVHLADLRSAAQLYARVMGLWLAWRDAVPHHVVRYERLVDDLEGEARALLEFLGEDWDPAVLRFFEAAGRRRISTPSHQDVSQPIFRRARGRWRRYAAEMAPVLPLLDPFVEAFGYGDA